jgi:DNA-binding FadR family transcriptional regulator
MIGGEADFRFHAHLVNAAHSPTLTSLYTAISHLLQRSHMQRRRRISEVPGIESFLIDHHRAVLAALVDADPDKADKVLAQHFEIGTNYQRLAMRLALEQHD